MRLTAEADDNTRENNHPRRDDNNSRDHINAIMMKTIEDLWQKQTCSVGPLINQTAPLL